MGIVKGTRSRQSSVGRRSCTTTGALDDDANASLSLTISPREYQQVGTAQFNFNRSLSVLRVHYGLTGSNPPLDEPRWSPQNRPYVVTSKPANGAEPRTRVFIPCWGRLEQTFFREVTRRGYTGRTWAEDTATQGCDRSADSGAGIPGGRVSIPARSPGPGILAEKR
jgi:hypothetical protein